MLLTAEQQGQMVFHILENDYHRPFIEGKCNRENIMEEIVIGVYKKEIPPITQMDVDFICDMVDSLLVDYGESK